MSTPARPGLAVAGGADLRPLDPRAVRVSLAPNSASAALAPLVLEPPEFPAVAVTRVADGSPIGEPPRVSPITVPDEDGLDLVLVDGSPIATRLVRLDRERALLLGSGPDGSREHVLLLPPANAPGTDRGVVRREVVVDGWRVEVEVEAAARAALRERARRGRGVAGQSGPIEVRAIIPGVVVSVSAIAGDAVTAGQQLLVVEAMKMQNELRAPWDGIIERVAVGPGETVEVGDVLIVLA